MLQQIWSALWQPPEQLSHVRTVGEGDLPSVYAVTDLAVASIASASLMMANLLALRHGRLPSVTIDRFLASKWFATSVQPLEWTLPPTWDSIAGDYQTSDGWIKLHTNAPLHRVAALRARGLNARDTELSREQIAAAVRTTQASALELEIIQQGGCAAQMRSSQDWARHPQGLAVSQEPLLAIRDIDSASIPAAWPLSFERPLEGIRVLDLTRILAGPIATRYLASWGAQVLRIDPLDWDEPVVAPEVTVGKRRARLDLKHPDGKNKFEQLLRQADVLVHGYRADALERLGLGQARRHELNPALVDVSLNAYGWTGEWSCRRGFDSLVQMSSGIAQTGMELQGKGVPTPLPVQALDHATGYMLAAAVLRGLARRLTHGGASHVRASLARTAALLTQFESPRVRQGNPLREVEVRDFVEQVEHTAWGPARRLLPAYQLTGTTAYWSLPAGRLGDGRPVFD